MQTTTPVQSNRGKNLSSASTVSFYGIFEKILQGKILQSPAKEFLTNWAERSLLVDVSHGDFAAEAKLRERSIKMPFDGDEQVLFHESAHMWLYVQTGFKNEYSVDYGAKVNTQEDWAYSFLHLTMQEVVEAEKKLTPRQIDLFERVLGEEKGYMRYPLSVASLNFIKPLSLDLGKTRVGNLVSEQETLRRPKAGHPMDNFHEFFASFVSSLTFGNHGVVLDKFSELKEQMNRSAFSKSANPAIIIDKTEFLLKVAFNFAKEMAVDLERGTHLNLGHFDELSNLKANLALMAKYFSSK